VKLILFDVDGTILRVRRQITRDLIASLLRDVLGLTHGAEGFDLHGKTDRQIVRELCEIAGAHGSVQHHAAEMERLIVDHWRAHLRPDTVELLPGAVDTIELLDARDDVALGLLTGNLEEGARLKLAQHELNRHFPIGAFGSDADHRTDLPRIALDRAAAWYGRPFAADDSLIIGDSFRDIECARSAGMHVLAVATGNMDRNELSSYDPDYVCDTLQDRTFLEHFLCL
jgi:phosphoglycolate phosphatase-like HAD superfamily hydrolase